MEKFSTGEFFLSIGHIKAPDKRRIHIILFSFSMKTYVAGTYQKRFGELLLMSTHDI